jgi:hypothetical protein
MNGPRRRQASRDDETMRLACDAVRGSKYRSHDDRVTNRMLLGIAINGV